MIANKKAKEINFPDGYQITLEHFYIEAYDNHTITIKRKNTDPEISSKSAEYPDVQFNLDTRAYEEFCEFFKMIGEY